MKKIITIVMCVLLVSLALVSCGGKKEAASTQAATTAPATTTTTAPATTTTVKAEAPKAEAPKAETPAPVAETPAPAAQAAEDKVVFRISNGAEPESLDPAKIQGVPEHRLYEALFEGLIVYDPKTADGIPGLAESWTVSEDGKQYTFKLRKANWSDGTPITANDVVYSWLRELAPETASPYAWFPVMFLEGAEAYNAGEADASAVGIRALDDYTFQMDLIGPLPYVIGALGHYSFAVVPQHAIEKYGDAWVLPENFVGNGPYVLKEWTPQSRIVCEKNEAYWDADAVKLDEVIFYASDDDNTNYNMYIAGEIDWLTGIAQDRLESAQMRNDYQVAPQLSTYYYTINTVKAPFDDPRVRKALSYAIDRETLVESVTKGGQLPCWGIVPDMAGYPGLGEAQFDPEYAQQLLAEAGYPNGVGFPEFSLLYNTNDAHKQIAEFVQRCWIENLGINVELENQEWATYLANRNAGNFDVARAGWVGDYQDPNTFLDMFVTGAGMNGGKYSNDTYDTLINEAARMEAGPDRFEVLLTAEDILINEDQAIIPFYFYVSQNMIDTNKWGGWYPNTMDYHPTKDIYLK
ncbi:MAG: peptide ABC transporter substrate-binding protein [Spirochaetales bacterium]|nr:peptide ABC transporter substrate-binding protein [Spirochaetales bacterium]